VGSDADFVIIDPLKRVTLTNKIMHHNSDYTPYEGYECIGYPVATYLRGQMIFDGEQVTGPPGTGRYLPRDPYLPPPKPSLLKSTI
jgi:dihydropyrimidinase